MREVQALLSDADGTLVDTVQLIRHGQYQAAYDYLSLHGIPEEELPTYAKYESVLNQHVGGKARETLERTVKAFYEAAPHHIDGVDYDELHALLNPAQDKLAEKYIKPYPGLDERLIWLGKLGIKLGIFTSGTPHHIVRNFGVSLPRLGIQDLYSDSSVSDQDKLAVFSEKMLSTYNLPAFTVVSADDITKSKPDPEGLNIAIYRLGVSPQHTAVLGDHSYDMLAAKAAGATLRIGVTHGFDDRQTLKSAGAICVIDSLDELPAALAA